jgi:Uma2 family endonuclease
MAVSTRTFEEMALANPRLELHRGAIREKPSMSIAHGYSKRVLGLQLERQLDPDHFWVHRDTGQVRHVSTGSYFVPDVYVIPIESTVQDRSRWDELEAYAGPLPLVVEIWSPSTGAYDIDEKIPEYIARGDLEVWRLHPFERELKVWRRREDGGYDVSIHYGGTIRLAVLPNVVIDLDALFP